MDRLRKQLDEMEQEAFDKLFRAAQEGNSELFMEAMPYSFKAIEIPNRGFIILLPCKPGAVGWRKLVFADGGEDD